MKWAFQEGKASSEVLKAGNMLKGSSGNLEGGDEDGEDNTKQESGRRDILNGASRSPGQSPCW